MDKLFLEFDEKTGEAFFDGIACEVTNRYYHPDLQRGFAKIIGKPAYTIMYNSAFTSGTILAQNIIRDMKGKEVKDIVKRVLWNLSARGFGAPELITMDEVGKKAAILVRNSYNLIGYKDSDSPVCHALGGLLGGLFSVILGEECSCTESQCTATGADSCMFEISGTGKKMDFVSPIEPKSKRKGLVKKELEHDLEKGEVVFDGISSTILMLGRTGIFQREFERIIGPTSRSIIYEECKKTTKKAVGSMTKTFVKVFGRLNFDAVVKKLVHQIPERGWGTSEIVEMDRKGCRIAVRVKNSYNHLYYGNTSKPACYSLASIIAGGSEIVFSKPMVCEETKCEALGDPYCEFVAVEDKGK